MVEKKNNKILVILILLVFIFFFGEGFFGSVFPSNELDKIQWESTLSDKSISSEFELIQFPRYASYNVKPPVEFIYDFNFNDNIFLEGDYRLSVSNSGFNNCQIFPDSSAKISLKENGIEYKIAELRPSFFSFSCGSRTEESRFLIKFDKKNNLTTLYKPNILGTFEEKAFFKTDFSKNIMLSLFASTAVSSGRNSGDLLGTGNVRISNIRISFPDQDFDFIPDLNDECPDSTKEVDSKGCALDGSQTDLDGDGIKDNIDRCIDIPGIPELFGCPPEEIITIECNFDSDCNQGFECKINKCIEKPVCISDWLCGDWSICSESGGQDRNCVDVNNCGTDEGIPAEFQLCNFEEQCTPDWNQVWTNIDINGDSCGTRTSVDLNECDVDCFGQSLCITKTRQCATIDEPIVITTECEFFESLKDGECKIADWVKVTGGAIAFLIFKGFII